MSDSRPLFRLLQKTLFLWVRVDILPRSAQELEWKDQTVLYVVKSRSLADLLVVDHCCRQLTVHPPLKHLHTGCKHHSLYSVSSGSPFLDWLLARRHKRSTMLEDLIEAIHSKQLDDIQVVPVSVFWGRPIARQKSWLPVLFSDSWVLVGRLRKLLTILFHGKNTTVIYSPSVSLKQLLSASDKPEVINDHFTELLSNQYAATFGPQKKSITDTIEDVLQQESVKKIIRREIQKPKQSESKVKKTALGYCREIFSNSTQISQEILKRLLNSFWNRYYSGIRVYDSEQIKSLALTHQLIYLPCHRSHVDYLLLSYVIFHEGLALPFIAAGKNLNLPVIGRILRGGGAFFIRRSFHNNVLYSAIMQGYIHELVLQGAPLEYFIEGGRSRSGKLLPAKLGLLSMTLVSWIKTQPKPLAFVPVNINYEKLIEGKSYIGELYGEKKKQESLLSTVRSIFNLKGQFGKVTVRFGKAIDVDDYLTEHQPDWKTDFTGAFDKKESYRETVKKLGTRVLTEINRATVIFPVNLIATTVLATPRQSIDIDELIVQCQFISKLARQLPFMSSVLFQEAVDRDEIERIQSQNLLRIISHPLGDMVTLQKEQTVLMSYYRNNSLHVWIIPSIIACCFINKRSLKQETVLSVLRYVYPFIASELHLPYTEEQLPEIASLTIKAMTQHEVLIDQDNKLKRPDRNEQHYILLLRLSQIAQPILERYYMTMVILWQSGENPLSEAQLEQRCHLLAQRVSMLHGVNAPDFFDRRLFGHFVQTMIRMNYVEKNSDNKLVFKDSFEQISLDTRALLSVEVRSTILQILKHHQN